MTANGEAAVEEDADFLAAVVASHAAARAKHQVVQPPTHPNFSLL